MNDLIELHRLFTIGRRRWWLLVGLTVLAASLGYGISQRQPPIYQAKATVLVGEMTRSTNLSREDVQISALFAQTYADLAVRQPVLQGVVEILHLDETWEELRKQVEVSSLNGTQLIDIRAEANTPELARSIANEVANHLILIGPPSVGDREGNFVQDFIQQQMEDTQVRILNGQQRLKEIEATMPGTLSAPRMVELQTEKTNLERLVADLVMNYVNLSNLASQDHKPNSLSIIEPAYANKDPIRPRVSLNVLLSGGLGMLLALGILFLWELMDDAIKSTEDLAQFEKLNLLGSVGRIQGEKYAEQILTQLEPSSPTREAFRMIRNKIRISAEDHPAKSLVVTSPEPGDGKSITAANLGVVMAKANLKTILVDADLRHPVLHQFFNVVNHSGLADLLDIPGVNIHNYLKDTEVKNLQILTSGGPSLDQSDRLLSMRISEILDELKEMADLIIIDSPPVLLAADATILANRADGVIVVVRARSSKRRAIHRALVDLQEANANLLGCIYNNLSLNTQKYRQEKTLLQRARNDLFH